MTLRKAVEISEERQKWSRSKPPYHGLEPVPMPYTPREIGEALDCLIAIAKDVLANHKANE